jgi:hypothetical protein
MTPGTLDLTIYKGVRFTRTLTCLDADGVAVDLTGYTAQADVRQKPTSPHVSFNLNPDIPTGTDGVITFEKIETDTDALTAGLYGWDLVLINGDDERLGPFIIGPVYVKDINSKI